MEININKMTQNDISLIEPDFSKNFDKFWSINTLKNDFDNEQSTYLVAKIKNEIVGFVGILKILDEVNIMNIATKINKRNLGIASLLLEKTIEISKQLNATSITLEVNEKNAPAIHLYEKYNFKRIGLRKKYYNNTDNAIIMTLSI